MKTDWTEHRSSKGQRFEAAHPRGWRLIAWLPTIPGQQSNYLMPARVERSSTGEWSKDAVPVENALESYASRQATKLHVVDRLGLSDLKFCDHFVSARLMLWLADGVADAEAWEFVRQGVRDLQQRVQPRLVTQIDYDQKLLHPTLGSILANIDFAVKHEPSAIATTMAYLRVLETAGVSAQDARFTVTGLGDLGSRVVRRLVEAGVSEVHVSDPLPERVLASSNYDVVHACRDADELVQIPCHAHILAANRSLIELQATYETRFVPSWVNQPELVAVGGPEAGLDSFTAARRVLGDAGKQVIPSVLCGSMGLVSNLEETLQRQPDLQDMSRRFDVLLGTLIGIARERRIAFHSACELFLSGASTVTSGAP